MYFLNDYDYDLPASFIAQKPLAPRDRSRLLYLDANSGRMSHHGFHQLPELLLPTDLLVINNTEVVPGRLTGTKDTGGKAEVLMLDFAALTACPSEQGSGVCPCLIKASKPPRPGTVIIFNERVKGVVLSGRDGLFRVKFIWEGDLSGELYQIGETPLPPYIKRTGIPGADRDSYQTVYASQKGAIAAPTAGFHFSENLLDRIRSKGIQIAEITLHVGLGTFFPVRAEDIRQHRMHSEKFVIAEKAADMIRRARKERRRIVAVGTTCVRTLEHAFGDDDTVYPGAGCCDLFIYPGYRFKVVDAMVTNFHLPKSTLLMLVAAFAGREQILQAYAEAKNSGYRFYSYGDAMLIASSEKK
ncbi:MAG: tRNA preQ1(34) S-adenosylmethionine ribosyltransferase-isomerase QueA [Desulfobacterales bacterium]|nr:tRNA preQ1(34) S-adenosylmethionine ribosyltransferase-isomerase QueA [Desulfobacterales bacterium]